MKCDFYHADKRAREAVSSVCIGKELRPICDDCFAEMERQQDREFSGTEVTP